MVGDADVAPAARRGATSARAADSATNLPELLELFERTRLTPRLGIPEDVAHMAVFLASDKASYITGQSFVVDGGGTAHQPWVGVK